MGTKTPAYSAAALKDDQNYKVLFKRVKLRKGVFGDVKKFHTVILSLGSLILIWP
jgi:hypothetical protein